MADQTTGERIHAVVRSHYDKLCDAVESANPIVVARRLFEKKLISSATNNETDTPGISKNAQASRLMNAVMSVLSMDNDGTVLADFLAVLRSSGHKCSRVADAVEADYTGVAKPTASSASKGMTEELHEANIMDVLCQGGFSNPDWKSLGNMLGLSAAQLDSIAADKKADNTAGLSNALISMLSEWLRRDVKSSWGKLADALVKQDETVLADKVRVQQDELTVNSIHDILIKEDFDVTSWQQLGRNLGLSHPRLKGIEATHTGNLSGAQVHALVAVLHTWLKRDVSASWENLADALEKIGYPKIAATIRA